MKTSGIIAIVLLVIFFWPLAFIPCLMDDCFEVGLLAYLLSDVDPGLIMLS